MAFENLELWWVTGAQLLYGGDAVVQVDAHSKEMAQPTLLRKLKT